jgi:hypothetical protein
MQILLSVYALLYRKRSIYIHTMSFVREPSGSEAVEGETYVPAARRGNTYSITYGS